MCTSLYICLKSKEKDQRRQVYLIGAAHQLEDVDLRMRFSVVCQQGVQVRDGRERTVLIGHTVQVSKTIEKKANLSHSANQQRRIKAP